MEDFRYDIVWRRIRRDEYAKKLEGKFRFRFERLSHLVNRGALSWLYRHATASKQHHHLGVEHNAMRFLAGDLSGRSKYRPSLRTAAHVMHWGHPPLSYQGAEALLRAAHVNPEIRALLETVVEDVISFGQLKCRQEGHGGRCAEAILAGERPFELYRWFAAWLVKDEWSRVWDAVIDAESAVGGTLPKEESLKKEIVRSLVCHEDRGFRILSHCNEADYVPRDLLQCGTAWLSLDLDVLWEGDPIGPGSADEWGLLASARGYLEHRFYSTPTALLLHSLTARIIANSFVSANFDLEMFRELLRTPEGDAYFDKTLTPHYRGPFQHLKAAADTSLDSEWWHVGGFSNVSVPKSDRFSAEDFFIDRTGRNRLSYPLSEGYSVSVELPAGEPPGSLDFAGSERQYVTVYCDYRGVGKAPKARPMLNALAKCESWIQRSKAREVGNSVMSWMLHEPVTQVTNGLNTIAEQILTDNSKEFVAAISELRGRKSFTELHEHGDVSFRTELIVDTDFGIQMSAAPFFLTLPWRGMRMAPAQSLLELVRSEALKLAAEESGGHRGFALELAVLADQLMDPAQVDHRFLIVNATQWSADRRSVREWDVIRIDLLPDGKWSVTATECAVNRTTAKDKEAEDKLGLLQKALKGSYGDFSSYKTYLATVDGEGEIEYEDAGRSYTVT